ncbi:conserved exported hypothetical protein [uncultured Thiomicrorhabdus sp.]
MRNSKLSLSILLMLAISMMLRPLMAEAALWAKPATPQQNSHHQHQVASHDACPHSMQNVARTSDSCETDCHHNHFLASYTLTACDDCGEQCDCVKHLHLQTLSLPTLAPLTLNAKAQHLVHVYHTLLVSAPSQNLERPPKPFNA